MHGHAVVSKPSLHEVGLHVCECGGTFDSPGEWADHYRAVTPRDYTCDDPSHDLLAQALYEMNGQAWYGRDLGPFNGHRMRHERARWHQQADHLRARLTETPAPDAQTDTHRAGS